LFLSKDWFKVVRVNCDIASIFLFRIDVLLSSKSIWFGSKMTRIKLNDKVELREILRPLHLLPDQHLGSKKFFSFLFLSVYSIFRIRVGNQWEVIDHNHTVI